MNGIQNLLSKSASLIHNRDYDDANAVLQLSLVQLKQELAKANVNLLEESSAPPGLPVQCFFQGLSSLTTPAIQVVPLKDSLDENQTLFAEQVGFAFYDGVFLVPPDMVGTRHFSLLCAIAMYNMGLSYHLLGLKGCTRAHEIDLDNALNLYQMTGELLKPYWDRSGAEGCGSFAYLLVLLALYNNMGHIHLLRFEHRCFENCVDVIQRLLGLVDRNGFLVYDHYSSIQLNGLLYNVHPILNSHSPAA